MFTIIVPIKKNFKGSTVTRAGKPIKVDVQFHLFQHELLEIELKFGGLQDYVNRAITTEDPNELYKLFMEFALLGYGKQVDELTFDKSEEQRRKFKNSLTFESLMNGLLTNQRMAETFLTNLLSEGNEQIDFPEPPVEEVKESEYENDEY